jgi:hypothetical protein
MLPRTIYVDVESDTLMILAALSGALLLVAFLAFFFNIVMSVGINGVSGIFSGSKLEKEQLLPEPA